MSIVIDEILDPTGGSELTADATLAPRLETLSGKTLGLLDNGKPNGAALLSELGAGLQREHRLRDVLMYTKPYFGTPVEESQIQQILENCDFAVAGIGD
ncbi:MAG: hypothetical protein GEV09_14775 [Pseudonocardiaceae bacterium]|nr:hypothetical protein [Pseudonocardiaceae bacterium]